MLNWFMLVSKRLVSMSFYKTLKLFDSILSNIEEWIVYILLAGMLTVVFLGVINRSFIHMSIPWSEELARYFMIWGVFIGASLGLKRSVHISVDALILIIPKFLQQIVTLFGNMVGFIFCAWFFYIGAEFIDRMMNMGPLSPALRMPMYIAYAAVPCGFALMSIRYLMSCLYFICEHKRKNIEEATENNKAVFNGSESK